MSDGDYQYDQYDDYSDDDGSDYNSVNEDTEITDVPEFVTTGNTYTFDEGTTIRLPCVVDKLPSKYRTFILF